MPTLVNPGGGVQVGGELCRSSPPPQPSPIEGEGIMPLGEGITFCAACTVKSEMWVMLSPPGEGGVRVTQRRGQRSWSLTSIRRFENRPEA
jgi:hypothetical protein